jgi:signal transduction histidine kinase
VTGSVATTAFDPPPWPRSLARLRALCAADEVASTLRHQALNELTGIGALLYRVRTRLGAGVALGGRSSMGELTPLFDSMEARLHGAPARLGFRFLPAPADGTRTELCAHARTLLEELGVHASVHSDRPAHGAIAPEELEVALGCLVENALEALALAGKEGELALQVDRRGDRWGIEVRDDGVGVEPAAFDHLFDPFFSTHPGRAGLGLKIARRIAHRWGGELLLARREPSGLSVVMLVPPAEMV